VKFRLAGNGQSLPKIVFTTRLKGGKMSQNCRGAVVFLLKGGKRDD